VNPVRRLVILIALVVFGACASSSTPPVRASFGISAYRFSNGTVEVDSQKPGDARCFVDPQLGATLQSDGLHLRVTYQRTHHGSCSVACPTAPLTLRRPLPPGSAGTAVILDPPQQAVCSGVPAGGPATVPSS
jgi:hypothetical protein